MDGVHGDSVTNFDVLVNPTIRSIVVSAALIERYWHVLQYNSGEDQWLFEQVLYVCYVSTVAGNLVYCVSCCEDYNAHFTSFQ